MPISLQIESHRQQLNKSSKELLAFAKRARTSAALRGTVSILVESNERMQAMNRHFRRKDKPTDVLSFPAAPAIRAVHAGDIAISADIAAENARAFGHSLADEIKVLILHGMLHLTGHDHETDLGEMARLESKLRTRLDLPASLTERASGKVTRPKTKRLRSRKPARIKHRQTMRSATRSSSKSTKTARAKSTR